MEVKEITREDLLNRKTPHLTVGQLKSFLEKSNLNDDSLVLIERVEDKYYEKHGWCVYISNESQYHPAHYCSKNKNDNDILFINLHY